MVVYFLLVNFNRSIMVQSFKFNGVAYVSRYMQFRYETHHYKLFKSKHIVCPKMQITLLDSVYCLKSSLKLRLQTFKQELPFATGHAGVKNIK